MSLLQENLIQKDAILDLVTYLFISTDQRDWPRVKSLFADEVLFDMTSLGGGEPSRKTPQEIVDGWDAGLKKLEAVHHQIGNFRVRLDDDGAQAEVFCYGVAYHYLPNPTGNNLRIFVGSYDIHLIRISDGWRIDGFRYNNKFVEGNKDLEASAG